MPVCVAGMHRSGTSMVAKFLHACGLYLGPDDVLMPPAPENPEGFWEHLGIVETNDEILNQLGGGWDCPPPEPADWTAGRLAPLVTRAERIVEPFADREPWGWKDPRTSLTLPFWQSIVDGLRVVVVVRNPLEVALSLRQRNGFSFALGLTLWEITNRRLLAAVPPADRIVTHYDAYFGDAQSEVRRLLDLLGMPAREEALDEIGTSATSDLRHHRLTIRDLQDADVSVEVIALYRRMCDEAGWRDTDGRQPDAVATARGNDRLGPLPDAEVAQPSSLEIGVGRLDLAKMDVRRLATELDEHRSSLEGREQRIAELEEALRAHESAQAERDELIAKLDRAIVERDERVAVRDAQIADLDARVVERDARLVERDGWIGERDGRLEMLYRERELSRRRLEQAQQITADQAEHLDLLAVQLTTLTDHEVELRSLLASAHEQLLHRDAEIVASLGSALYPHAPGAPAAIYYRHLLQKIRTLVETSLPPSAPILVVSGGDEAMLDFGDRPARHFPPRDTDVAVAYRPTDDATARAQLDLLREQGAEFLVIPASGRAWLARHPGFRRHLQETSAVLAGDEATAVLYALNGSTGSVP